MTEEKPTVVEDLAAEQPHVVVGTGTGKTAELEGAQAKTVHNVSGHKA